MDLLHALKRIYWYSSARYAAWKNPLPQGIPYLAVTGTDGKTTTASFMYEIAKAYGYNPILITTVDIKFQDEEVLIQLKSSTFFAYSLKECISGLKKKDIKHAFKNLLFLDKASFDKNIEEHRSTPLAGELRKIIHEYHTKGASLVILEVTSHSLDQYRTLGIVFDSAVITNITEEHLDYHKTWENYAETKAKLLAQVKEEGAIALNRNDERSYDFLHPIAEKLITQNKLRYTEFHALDINEMKTDGFWLNIQQHNLRTFEMIATSSAAETLPELEDMKSYFVKLNFFGEYNIYNALAAYACFTGLVQIDSYALACDALSHMDFIKGRMQFLSEKPRIIVDFAHTPNGMEQALKAVKKNFASKKGEIWVVFGCAGSRDHYKRPQMGSIAFTYADNILITAEDPRTEDLARINNEIIAGFKDNDSAFTIHTYYNRIKFQRNTPKFIMRFDEPSLVARRDAITFAINHAQPNDTIIILGKGHETTMCFGTEEQEWNDIDEVNKLIS